MSAATRETTTRYLPLRWGLKGPGKYRKQGLLAQSLLTQSEGATKPKEEGARRKLNWRSGLKILNLPLDGLQILRQACGRDRNSSIRVRRSCSIRLQVALCALHSRNRRGASLRRVRVRARVRVICDERRVC